MHVLLIEPDTVLAKTYSQALEAAGHTVSAVLTAQAAVRAADAKRPDTVVLNVDLARHNGVEFLYEFKSYTEWRDVPVLLLVSGLNHDLADHAGLRETLGVQGVLVQSRLRLKQLCEAVAAATGVAGV